MFSAHSQTSTISFMYDKIFRTQQQTYWRDQEHRRSLAFLVELDKIRLLGWKRLKEDTWRAIRRWMGDIETTSHDTILQLRDLIQSQVVSYIPPKKLLDELYKPRNKKIVWLDRATALATIVNTILVDAGLALIDNSENLPPNMIIQQLIQKIQSWGYHGVEKIPSQTSIRTTPTLP